MIKNVYFKEIKNDNYYQNNYKDKDGMKKELNKIKITIKRAAIIEELKNRDDHPTADDLYFALKKDFPSLSIATVYRNLKILSKFGMIDEIQSKNKIHFDGNTKLHYHLKCIKCEKIIDLDEQYINHEVVDTIAGITDHKNGSLITNYKLEFSGVCSDCAKDNHYNEEECMGCKTTEIGENEKTVIAALEKLGVSGSKDIALEAKLEPKIVSAVIKKLKNRGFIESPARCKYSITEQGKEQISYKNN